MSNKYEVNNSSVDSILAWIKQGEIAIPEIQRPFVWDATKVRDLIDSLYNGTGGKSKTICQWRKICYNT